MSEDEFDFLSDLDDLIDEEEIDIKITTILLIASDEIHEKFKEFISVDTYRLIHTTSQELATSYLISESIAVAFIDSNSVVNITGLSSSIHQYIPLSRIVLITSDLETENISSSVNNGVIDAILPASKISQSSIMNILSQQAAKYSINKMLISMITEPPTLSKASFLLLDPTLQFGSEHQPLNFVGIMIICNTVPKYTKFFEETLAKDEFLFAGYLSSITGLGNSLFEADQALKEINFGGISVIFQFHEDLQIFFFIRNLNRQNTEKAEQRITNFVKIIVKNYYDKFQKIFLSNEVAEEIDNLVLKFDEEDEIDKESYEKLQESKVSIDEDTPLVIYSRNEGEIIKEKLLEGKLGSPEDNFQIKIETISSEEELIPLIRGLHDVMILDTYLDSGTRSIVDFIDFLKEISPSLQIIILERELEVTDAIIESYNNDTVNYLLPFSCEDNTFYRIFKMAKEKAIEIKAQSALSAESGTPSNIEAMKVYFREEQDAYTEEEQPELSGIILSESMQPVFNIFWEDKVYDTEMITGLVKSLVNIGEEMFHEKEEIRLLEVAGFNVFVNHTGKYMLSFFAKHINPSTSVLIRSEINAVSSIYSELLEEAAGILTYAQLNPIFTKLANETRNNFTNLLRESQRENKEHL